MPELNFTPEQRAAIDTRGSTVLVSAAAGSGKTRVLTERLMAYLTDAEHPVDIDHFLVITYTRAAAAELRSRILDGIYARIASDPENRRLRRHPSACWPTRSAAGATMRAWASWCSRSMTKCSATHGPSSGRSGKWTCSRSTA